MSKQSNQPEGRYRKHHVRATATGFANNVMYSAGDEFDYTIDPSITPPSWVEILDEGEPVNELPNLNANDFAKAEIPRNGTGFARGHSV